MRGPKTLVDMIVLIPSAARPQPKDVSAVRYQRPAVSSEQ